MMLNTLKRNSLKYHTFHREIGHIIEEFKILKNELTKLIQNGYVKEITSQHEQWANQEQSDQNVKNFDLQENGQVKKVIHTIHKGSKYEDTRFARLCYIKAVRESSYSGLNDMTDISF